MGHAYNLHLLAEGFAPLGFSTFAYKALVHPENEYTTPIRNSDPASGKSIVKPVLSDHSKIGKTKILMTKMVAK